MNTVDADTRDHLLAVFDDNIAACSTVPNRDAEVLVDEEMQQLLNDDLGPVAELQAPTSGVDALLAEIERRRREQS